EVYLYLDIAGNAITARVEPRSKAKVGDTVRIAIDASLIHVFDKETERVITN
ncbi:MAG: TOBE domain-containing protein, partial [Defluviitaleaceae bacterium]|nr:TOBE domain-containing protein [Defluviitaleaceae bacterium]